MEWKVRGASLAVGARTLVMGIVNVTPDSFSDGGRHPTEGTAYAHGMTLWREGADIVDVGGESTRPGAQPVTADEEKRRVVPVIRRLVEAGCIVSVDTSKAEVADAALAAGAHIINDVTAGRDPEMFAVVARHGAGMVLMHMLGTPRTMQDAPAYEDVAKEVAAFLAERVLRARAAGIANECLVLDPGLGFGKTVEHNIELIARLREIRALGHPVLVGASRKGFLGKLTADKDGRVPGPMDRREAGLSAHVLAVANGADAVRVHNVRSTRRAFALTDRVVRGE